MTRALSIVLVMLALACDHRQPRAEGRGLTAEAEADTVVRTIRRYARQPSALQRVTGSLIAREALRPLDSVLAVRVLDSRGSELRSVIVSWTVSDGGGGAALRVVNALTDSTGVSRARFTPGSSAGIQRVMAEVADVGRIEFPITIPARSIRHSPADIVIWAGDDTTVTAILHDATSQPLAGGNASWAASDPTTVRVGSSNGTTARVRAVAAGTTQIFSFSEPSAESREPTASPARGTTRVTVRPVVHGRLVTLDGSVPPSARVVLAGEGVRDTLASVGGVFTRRVLLDPGVPLRVQVFPEGDAFHAADVRVGRQRDLQSLTIVLLPTRFSIDAGSYRGQSVPIDVAAALRRGSRGAPFWRVVPLSGDGPRTLLGWRDAEYPLRIAFNRPASSGRITVADSIAFWEIANILEADLGRDVFTPADLADSTRGNIVRVEIRPQSSDGHTFVAWEQAGDAQEGIVLLRDASMLRDAHVVTHELVHLLGFGHATGWASVSQAVNGSARRLTVEDVAYMQLAMRLRSAGGRPGLPASPALGLRP